MTLSAGTIRTLYNTVLGSSSYGDAMSLAQIDMGADGFIWNDFAPGANRPVADGFTRQLSKSFAGVKFPDANTTLVSDPRVSFVLAQQDQLYVASENLGRTFGKDDYHQKFLEGTLGTRYTMGFSISGAGHGELNCLLGIHNLTSRGSFSEHSKMLARELLSITKEVRRLQFDLSATRSAASSGETALNSLGDAVFVADRHLRLRWTNQVGEAILRKAEKLFLSSGVICCRPPRQALLNGAINDVLLSGTIRQIPMGSLGNLPIIMTVASCIEPGFFIKNPLESGSVVLRIQRIVETIDVAEQATRIYGFTKSEALLVADLAAGKSVIEHSQSRGVKISTARFHVRAILDKTHSRDLQALSLLLGRLSA